MNLTNLYLTWRTAVKSKHPYFEGNGMQGTCQSDGIPGQLRVFQDKTGACFDQFDFPVDSLFPLRLAQLALEKFREYNDLYQIAGAYVSIGKYLNAHGCYQEALDTLSRALDCKTTITCSIIIMKWTHWINYIRLPKEIPLIPGVPWIAQEKVKTVPEWISRIREQAVKRFHMPGWG